MNKKRLFAKLKKTERTLSNHVHGGPYYHGINNARTQDLVDRFNDLRAQAIDLRIWSQYCEQNGLKLPTFSYWRGRLKSGEIDSA